MLPSSNAVLVDYPQVSFKEKFNGYIEILPRQIRSYFFNLFPIIQWIHRYSISWLLQDAIAGITVGMLIVPQGIAYAKIANLDPQYGLYTSFVGVTLYCFFGTSKDISIGPITVVSLLVGQAITKVKETHPEITGPEVAVCLSLFAGLVLIPIGLTRLGILVDFISEPAIAGYMTGSAITISMGQWPKVFGLKINTHDPPYLIFIHLFQHLKETRLDAAFGLISLVALYVIKIGGAKLVTTPALKKPLFFLSIMRSGLVVILGTLISYAINLHHRSDPLVHIIKDVPAGFDAMAVPSLNLTILKEASGVLPSIVLILILEHVSVAKSFGSTSHYTIDPNQEILAIGVSNIVGAFFGAYPCTGAFSRTAVMSRSGAKTPMAGVFSGAVVVLALYVLTPAFYYIPEAVLGAVVIHAVIDLIAGPSFIKELWNTSMLEFMVFAIAVVVTCFVDVETAIYIAIALSLFLMLLRIARPQVVSMGRVKVSAEARHYKPPLTGSTSSTSTTIYNHIEEEDDDGYIYVNEKDPNFSHNLDSLPSGMVIIQLRQSMLYPNSGYISERIQKIVESKTRPGRGKVDVEEELQWSQTPVHVMYSSNKASLKYLVFDFSAVDTLDATALHHLKLLRKTLNDYTGGSVEWHFCHISTPQVRQLLIDSGFGSLPEEDAGPVDIEISQDQNSLQAPTVKIDPYYPKESPLKLLPKDTYPGFHWSVESAVYSIRTRQSSSVTVTIY